MSKIFDLHFHFLLKHAISNGIPITQNVQATGVTRPLDELMGGPLASQSSPNW